MTWWRISVPHFVAAVATHEGCVKTAPILSWSWHGTSHNLFDYCRRKGWQVELLP